ncbi:MAG: leucine-rich repeat protein, partial [Bacteroidales bacterium]|nr:leucine-rich repeat protein [Bacteroidales bacterium]
MKRLLFTFLFLAASVGMSWALEPLSGDTWDNTTKILTVNADPGKNGYKNNTEIEHVVITDGVTSLANGAFYGCTSLTSVTLPSGLTTIGTDAFRETSLASVSLPSGLISIGSNAFNQCTALASVTFPEGLATIDVGAFSGCSSLTSVTLPESLTTINVGVFSGCTSLASVTIFAPSLYTYGKSVFYDTASGLKIYVPAGSVDTYKTNWSAYEDKIVAIGSGEPATTVTWDNTNVFTEANQNEIVGAADGWKTKTKATFEGVTISFDGTTESSSKFMCFDAGENDLKPRFTIYGNEGDSFTFTAPEGKKFSKIEIIDNGETFFTPYGDWTKPEDKKVVWNGTPANAVTLGGTGITNFDHLNSIVFTLAPAAPANSCGGGLTWELNNGELVISYDGEGTGVMNDYDIPNDNPAPWYANRENITSVSLPEGIKTIGKDAFRDCVNLTTVTIPNSVTTIGESAFVSVEHLETVTIGTGITSIVNGAFYGNAELTTVTCSATTPPSIGEMVFGGCPNLEHIYVPAESVDAYKTAWSAYASLISAAGGGSTDVIPCTPADLGKVLCTDGSIYATVSEASAASKTAAAVIAYVDTQNGKALALALADDGGEMEWAPAKTTAPAHTPVVSNGTWKLPTKDDWNNMITAAGGYEALRDGFSAVGGTNMQQDAYWSSTPENDNAWIFYFAYGGKWVDDHVDNPCYVRACLEFDIPAAPAYETVMNLINEIPNPVVLTAECKAKIDAARAAFDALSDGDKDLVTNIATLTTAEAAFENVMNIWLSGDCDVILWNDTTLTSRKHAGEGNGAMADYNYMSRAPWYSAHWYDPKPNDIVIKSVTIEEGVTHLGDYAFAWMSEMKAVTIPSSVTTIPEDAFYWSKAVDDIYFTADPSNLTWALPHSADGHFKENKATICHVPVDMLVAYQDKFTEINVTFVGDLDPITPLTPEQQQALDAVKGLINAIPSPVVYTEACEDAIAEAGAAYDALDDELKPFVVNYAVLTAAEATYANLKDVVVVEAKINAIPQPVELKLATRDSIESARAAYDALTADQQALVSNY